MQRTSEPATRESDLQAALSRLLDAAAGAGAEEAREHARDIIALGQDALEAHGDLAFAERCLEEALGLDPDCEEALALAQAIDAARNRPAPGAGADASVGTPEPQADAAVGEASRTDAAARARESMTETSAGAPEPRAPSPGEAREGRGPAEEAAPAPEVAKPSPPPSISPADRFNELLRAFAARPDDLELRAAVVDAAQKADLERVLVERWADLLETEEDGGRAESLREGLIALLERLKRRAIREGDEDEERALTVRIAGLLDRSNPERAISLYSAVLEGRPDHDGARQGLLSLWREGGPHALSALEALDRFLARDGDHQLRVALREEALERTVEPERRWALLREIALIAEESLANPRLAFDASARAFSEGSEEAARHLERLAKAAGTLRELCDLFEVEAARREGREARDLRARAAVICEEELGDRKGAVARWNAILGSFPDDREAMEALERNYRALGLFGDLARLYEIRIAQESVAEERRALLLELGKIQLDQLEDEMAAVEAYRRVLELDPGDREAFESLAEIFRTSRRHRELAALCEERIAYLEGRGAAREARELRVELASVLLRLERDPREGFALLGRVLAEEPRHPGALSVLETIVEEEEGRRKVEAARLLAPIYLEEREFSQAVRTLEILALAEEDPAERARLYLQVAEIHTTAQPQPALAFVAASRALRARPESSEALDLVLQTAARASLQEELVALLDEIAPFGGGPESRKRLNLALARAAEAIGDEETALRAYLEARSIDPDDRDLLEAEVRLRARSPDAVGYVDALRALLRLAVDEAERRRLLWEIARVQRERIGDLAAAWETLTDFAERWPDDARALEALEEVAAKRERWTDVAAVLDRRLARERGPARAALELRLAELKEGPLLDRAGAIRIYARILEADPANGPALERLERLLESDPGNPTIAAVMDKAYRARMDWAGLCDLLEHRVSYADRSSRKGLLLELAELRRTRQNRPDLAFLALHRAFREDPADRALWSEIAAAARAADCVDEWIATASEELDRFGNASVAAELALHLADLSEREGDAARAESLRERALAFDADRTIAHYRELLSRDPRNAALRERLCTILEGRGSFGELAELLESSLPAARDARERIAMLLRLAALRRDRLGDLDGAVDGYRAVLEQDPRSREALEALRSLYALRGEDERLEEVLRRLIPLQDDPADVKAVRLDLFECLVRLGKRQEAIEAAGRILDLPPHRKEELLRLESVLGEWKAHAERIRILEALVAVEPVGDVERLREIARLWRDELRRPHMAAQALERVLERHPRDEAAFAELRALYRQAADFRRYAAATERFLSSAVDDRQKVELLLDLAKVLEERLGQRDLAFARVAAALGLAPRDPRVVQALWEIAERGGNYEELSLVLESVAEESGERSLWLLRGRLLDEKLDDPREAEASYRRVLEHDPYHPEALAALERLFEARGEHVRLAEILERQVEIAASPAERQQRSIRLGRVLERSGQLDRALDVLREAFDLDPTHAEAASALRELLERQQRYEDLVALLARLRDLVESPRERIGFEREIAEICEMRLDDDAGAIAAHERILEIDADDLASLDALERLYTQADRASELLGIYDRKLRLAESRPKEQARIYLKAASIWEEKLGNLPNAIACLDAALELEPDNLSALRDLERLLRAEEQWQRLAEAYLRHEALLASDPRKVEERAEIWTRLGDLYLNELQQIDRAERAYRTAFELDPGAQEAALGLGAIYERTGNWTDALQLLSQQASRAGQGPEAVELHYRMGRIYREMLLDADSARSAFLEARKVDPGHIPSIQALKELAFERGDAEGYLEYLLQEASYTPEPGARAACFFEAGRFLLERGDRAGAIRYFEETLRHDGSHLDAARRLVELYREREDWEGAERALDVLCRELSPGRDAEELVAALCALGEVCERRENRPKAMECYARAYELDPTHLPGAEGLARLRMAAGDTVQALKIYQNILIHHREDLEEAEVVELHRTIGDLRARLGDRAGALKSLRTALELDPEHVPSLRALIQVAEEDGQYDEALRHRHRLLHLLQGAERRDLLRSTARLARDRLDAPDIAAEALVAYLREVPGDLEAMEELLDLYERTRQAARAIELLERMLKTPEAKGSPRRAAAYHIQLGKLHRDEGRGSPDWLEKAALHFESALNLDFRQTEAFSALEKMLVGAGKWDLLEESYLRMIERLSGKVGYEKARASLFRNLADLYYEVLDRPTEAMKAYKAVVALEPSDTVARERYAELVAREAGSEEEAIRAYRKLLTVPESRVAAAKALVKLHARRRAFDDAYVAAQVVSHLLGEGGRDEEGILARLEGFSRASTEETLVEADFKGLLCHPDALAPTAEIFGLLYREAGALFASGLDAVRVQGKTLRIDPERDRVDIENSMLFFANACRYACATLGIAPPAVFRSDAVVGLAVAGTYPLCLVAGPDMFSEKRRKKELYFLLGRYLVFTRPDFAFASLLKRDELQVTLEAALSLGEPRFEPTSEAMRVEKVKSQLAAQLGDEARERLARLARESVGKRLSLRRYVESVEFTATRAGTLLGGDLKVVSRCLVSEGTAGSRLGLDPLVDDLVAFCLSEAYGELRRKLKLAIEVPE